MSILSISTQYYTSGASHRKEARKRNKMHKNQKESKTVFMCI